MCVSTRDEYSKPVRDLLTTLCGRYPTLISATLLAIQEHILSMGELCLYLFKELPLHIWKPTEEDFYLLSTGLMQSSVSSHENNLARLILAHLNWNFVHDDNEQLFLPYSIHFRTAVLLVDATTKHYSDGMVKGSETSITWENWVWKFVLKLRLHILDQEARVAYSYFNDPSSVLRHIPENQNQMFSGT